LQSFLFLFNEDAFTEKYFFTARFSVTLYRLLF